MNMENIDKEKLVATLEDLYQHILEVNERLDRLEKIANLPQLPTQNIRIKVEI